MGIEPVASPDDPRLAWYRGVADPSLLRQGGRFIAEGRTVVARLLEDRRWHVESVLVSPTAEEALRERLRGRCDVPVFVLEPGALMALAGYNIHRGCLAVATRRPLPPWQALLPENDRPMLALGIEGLANADNVGACFRNAAAFGAGAVLLDDRSADPLYRKAIRTSMGATLQVPFTRVGAWPDVAVQLRAAGTTCIGLTPSPEAEGLLHVDPEVLCTPRLLLLVGHEGDGLGPSTLAACDRLARIDMAGGTDSLNVATAAAIALHVVATARRANGQDS